MSSDHGKSQQHVFELFRTHIPQRADDGNPRVVLLDEVESMAVARSESSLSVNPVDVHRATDVVLTALDWLTKNHPHIVTVATSNFTSSLDAAFLSRADVALEAPRPDAAAIQAILVKTLQDFATAYPALEKLTADRGLGGSGPRHGRAGRPAGAQGGD
jgi:SpoVK/Ycf46/Vps4 family AAA+-type ATPase